MIRRWAATDMASNLLWLAVSLLLAVGVWYIAVTSADPIQSSRFSSRLIRFVESDTTVITSRSTRSATVTVQGPQTIIALLQADDIDVSADLRGLASGVHSVHLEVEVAVPESTIRRPVAQAQPSQITVELESRETHERKIVIEVVQPPPIGFRNDAPLPNVEQIFVSGAASIVAQVVSVVGELDLSDSQNPVDVDLRLFAIDADGNRVNDVELDPQTATVSVKITRRDDIRRIAVRPDIRVETLPAGYTFLNYSYDPPSLFIAGAPEQLEQLSDTLLTEAISLENRQEAFVTTVLIRLMDEELVVVGSDNNVTVSIEIVPITGTRQIDGIEVGQIGLGADYSVSIVPKFVSAIVNAPVVLMDALSAEDIQVLVDFDGLEPGVYDREPSVSIVQGELSEENVSLVPREVSVEIVMREPDAETSEALEPGLPDA